MLRSNLQDRRSACSSASRSHAHQPSYMMRSLDFQDSCYKIGDRTSFLP
ncbi:MAG: hypothetical protein HWQ41_03060 [Nostoc sp. NOS(2021)]|nr:hypothetical protein [Nostoc sp. NOS(2021)]MBN3894272.1 hypothetical protein [Nostoc sp. NOS(2021)]